MKLRLASRKSDLARIQAYSVGNALCGQFPDLDIQYHFSSSLGDQNLNDPLWKMPEKGVFTSDLTESLKRGECDLVIHSWKDLPIDEQPETAILATLPRADVRDVLLLKKTCLVDRPSDLLILSSSPRREYHLGSFLRWSLPWSPEIVKFQSVRGNVQTRVKKLLEGEAAGLIVAKAALDRLLQAEADEFKSTREFLRSALDELVWQVIPLSQCPAAPAQGALAIEGLRKRSDLAELLQSIHCKNTFANVQDERKIFKQFGGGCHQKIGITQLALERGTVRWMSGVDSQGFTFSSRSLLDGSLKKVKISKDQMFPDGTKRFRFFDREALAVDLGSFENKDLWVSRAEAWPSSIPDSFPGVVWVSGVETWRKLAAKGQWVHGTNDSLGESINAGVDSLLGRSPDFLKLTHNGLDEIEQGLPALATYRLVSRPVPKDLFRGKTHFYWMSFSGFLAAIEADPTVVNKNHACGPGNTFALLSKYFKDANKVEMFLCQEDWLQHYLEAGK